jgi:hypothetical protein
MWGKLNAIQTQNRNKIYLELLLVIQVTEKARNMEEGRMRNGAG